MAVYERERKKSQHENECSLFNAIFAFLLDDVCAAGMYGWTAGGRMTPIQTAKHAGDKSEGVGYREKEGG